MYFSAIYSQCQEFRSGSFKWLEQLAMYSRGPEFMSCSRLDFSWPVTLTRLDIFFKILAVHFVARESFNEWIKFPDPLTGACGLDFCPQPLPQMLFSCNPMITDISYRLSNYSMCSEVTLFPCFLGGVWDTEVSTHFVGKIIGARFPDCDFVK